MNHKSRILDNMKKQGFSVLESVIVPFVLQNLDDPQAAEKLQELTEKTIMERGIIDITAEDYSEAKYFSQSGLLSEVDEPEFSRCFEIMNKRDESYLKSLMVLAIRMMYLFGIAKGEAEKFNDLCDKDFEKGSPYRKYLFLAVTDQEQLGQMVEQIQEPIGNIVSACQISNIEFDLVGTMKSISDFAFIDDRLNDEELYEYFVETLSMASGLSEKLKDKKVH